jgi:hypothetical protein
MCCRKGTLHEKGMAEQDGWCYKWSWETAIHNSDYVNASNEHVNSRLRTCQLDLLGPLPVGGVEIQATWLQRASCGVCNEADQQE